MATTGLKSYDLYSIPRGRAAQLVSPAGGGATIVEAAERAGVITMHRTQTGRSYMTARQFDELIKFAQQFSK